MAYMISLTLSFLLACLPQLLAGLDFGGAVPGQPKTTGDAHHAETMKWTKAAKMNPIFGVGRDRKM